MKNNKTVSYEGKNYKVFQLKIDSLTFDVICVPTRYIDIDTLAIEIFEVDVNTGTIVDDFTTLTVNLCNYDMQSDTTAFLDTNNNPWASKFVEKNKLGMNTYIIGASGFCHYPLYSFDLDRLTA